MTAILSLPPVRSREPLRIRAIILIVIVLIHIALLLALFLARTASRPTELLPTVVRLIPLPRPAAAPPPKATPKAVKRPAAIKVPTPIVKVPPQPSPPPALFKTEMMEAVDISKLPSHKPTQTADSTGTATAGTGTAADDGYGPSVGSGPHGEKVFAAEWYREPTHAEIAPYLPKHLPDVSEADIVCRTIERFGVEDCQEAGESPSGTGLSRAIRQAGWPPQTRA